MPMNHTYKPEHTWGQTCGIVVFRSMIHQLQPKEKVQLARFTFDAIQRCRIRACHSFLISLYDECSIYIARILLRMRKTNTNIRIFAIASDDVNIYPLLSHLIISANIEEQLDEVIYLHAPKDDFPLQIAMRSDHLIVHNINGHHEQLRFLYDFEYIDFRCTLEII